MGWRYLRPVWYFAAVFTVATRPCLPENVSTAAVASETAKAGPSLSPVRLLHHQKFPPKRLSSSSILQNPTATTAAESEKAAAGATGTAGEAATDPSLSLVETKYGWQDQENQLKRQYVCRYSQDGGPCRERADGKFPTGLRCPPGHCCSRTHLHKGSSGQWCAPMPIVCGGILEFEEYSWGPCTCDRYKDRCQGNSICRQEDAPLGGAYCECKEGYIGDGINCILDACKSNPCYPGTCANLSGVAQCTCPEHYEVERTRNKQSCKVADSCKDSPCGDIVSTKSCTHEGPGRYTCECKTGYIAVEVNNKLICDDVFNHLVCSASPCGATGVQECLDTQRGVRCVCTPGYELVKETTRYRCNRQDPCLKNPCGMPDIVTSCVATSTSYVCNCKAGYKVAMENGNQYCVTAEQETNYVLYAGIGGGVLILLFSVFACNYMRSGPELDEDELRFLQESGGNGVSETAYFDPGAGWA